MSARTSPYSPLLILLLALAALALTGLNLTQQLPVDLWRQAAWQPHVDNIDEMLFHYSLLPRTVLSLLVGAGLGLAGLLFQQILRNPLAEPTTLGVSAGAQLGLTVAMLWALPGGESTRQLATILGALTVGGLVFGVSWGRRLSPVTLILAGLVLGLYCGSARSLLSLLNYERLQGIFLWSSGMLNQQDWSKVSFLWPRLVIGLMLVLLMLRPLMLMGLDDGIARNLGLGLITARVGGLGIAIVLSAFLVNAAGNIGFIGLFAPLLARMLGARRLLQRLWLSCLLGALLLLFSDQMMIMLARRWLDIPTGAATALLGAPLLLWLLPRLRNSVTGPEDGTQHPGRERQLTWVGAVWGVALLLLLACLALTLGRADHGWYLSLAEMWRWRWPRVLAAGAAGAILAAAGALIQKMTGNPMASPEVLGISSGAALGIVLMLLLVPGDAFVWLLPAGSLGAAATLLLIMLLAQRGGFSGSRLLLGGIALSTLFSTLLTLMLISNDPRMASVLTWLSGSTYKVSGAQALWTALIAVILLAATPLLRRWLALLPLGGATARSAGVALKPARAAILLLAAGLIAAATLNVGPLSFVGLMAPHMARLLGFRRPLPQLAVAGLLGGMLMIAADWCGRIILFPYQIPAGLLATFFGAPYFIYLLRRPAG
ncbi:Fe(3+)-hydroxamate ABC transporter permease FhuB [Sodalis ligni]|uniref:Fe(3+)-hydroxamate ABC transporter permease FhuB n=1 Tax=Sodalis ligni TaxID=2697027 RepID=UPI001BDF027A|nr:Fe(3+)-hydroxamate ABC transporter permease FhuB [Sodalis ligni]QWA10898.1 Fe(3+)-hydroxamate ABC transporter permease FhuB [Sodalis ligni]